MRKLFSIFFEYLIYRQYCVLTDSSQHETNNFTTIALKFFGGGSRLGARLTDQLVRTLNLIRQPLLTSSQSQRGN